MKVLVRTKTGSLDALENKDGLQGEPALEQAVTGEGVRVGADSGEVWAVATLGTRYEHLDKCHNCG